MTKEVVIFLFIAIVEVIHDLIVPSDSFASGNRARYHHRILHRVFGVPYHPMRTIPAGIILCHLVWQGLFLAGLIDGRFGQNWMCRLLLACCLPARGVIVINLFSKARH